MKGSNGGPGEVVKGTFNLTRAQRENILNDLEGIDKLEKTY
jgi:hypothetical protein